MLAVPESKQYIFLSLISSFQYVYNKNKKVAIFLNRKDNGRCFSGAQHASQALFSSRDMVSLFHPRYKLRWRTFTPALWGNERVSLPCLRSQGKNTLLRILIYFFFTLKPESFNCICCFLTSLKPQS